MIFQISPKLSVARDLAQTYRQTVPQTKLCYSIASVTKSVVGAQKATTILGDKMNVSSQVGRCK